MAANNILPFAPVDTGTNLDSQATYAAATDRTNGNQPGVARSKLVNKALRQSSIIAAGVAQFIADNQGADVNDTLTPAQVAAMLKTASKGVLIGVKVFETSGTYNPTPGTRFLRVRIIGAGGAGGFAAAASDANGLATMGGGGGSGGWCECMVYTAFTGIPVIIGSGGQSTGSSSSPGGSTGFGALLVIGGGGAGSSIAVPKTTSFSYTAQGTPGPYATGPALASGMVYTTGGNYGVQGITTGGQGVGFSGQGGHTPFGAAGQQTDIGAGNGGQGAGAGGGGACGGRPGSGIAYPGGPGANGRVIVEEFS